MKLLIISADEKLSEDLRESFTERSWKVGRASDLEVDPGAYKVVIFDPDQMFPGLGFDHACEQLKKFTQANPVPVLVLTSRDRWGEKVAGFDAGADDYLTKPFHFEELHARVQALGNRK